MNFWIELPPSGQQRGKYMVLIKPESACVATFIPFYCIRELFHHPCDMGVHRLHLTYTPTAITPHPPSSRHPYHRMRGQWFSRGGWRGEAG